MLTYQHVLAINRAVKQGLFSPQKHTQIIPLAHLERVYNLSSLTFPVTWQLVDRVWLGEGGAFIFIDPELETG